MLWTCPIESNIYLIIIMMKTMRKKKMSRATTNLYFYFFFWRERGPHMLYNNFGMALFQYTYIVFIFISFHSFNFWILNVAFFLLYIYKLGEAFINIINIIIILIVCELNSIGMNCNEWMNEWIYTQNEAGYFFFFVVVVGCIERTQRWWWLSW